MIPGERKLPGKYRNISTGMVYRRVTEVNGIATVTTQSGSVFTTRLNRLERIDEPTSMPTESNLPDELMTPLLELYRQYCRLKGYPLPRNNFEQWIDESSGIQKKSMEEFVKWLHEEILTRLPR